MLYYVWDWLAQTDDPFVRWGVAGKLFHEATTNANGNGGQWTMDASQAKSIVVVVKELIIIPYIISITHNGFPSNECSQA
jgi:hypothetical protein